MNTLLIMVLLTLLSIAALSTGVVLIIASFSEGFVSWLITRVSGEFLITITAGFTLMIIGLYIKKGQKWFLDFKIKNQISKALQEYLKKDIKATMEAIKANESISKRREQLLKENKDLVKKYMNGDLPLSKEVKEALKKYPDGEENFK